MYQGTILQLFIFAPLKKSKANPSARQSLSIIAKMQLTLQIQTIFTHNHNQRQISSVSVRLPINQNAQLTILPAVFTAFGPSCPSRSKLSLVPLLKGVVALRPPNTSVAAAPPAVEAAAQPQMTRPSHSS